MLAVVDGGIQQGAGIRNRRQGLELLDRNRRARIGRERGRRGRLADVGGVEPVDERRHDEQCKQGGGRPLRRPARRPQRPADERRAEHHIGVDRRAADGAQRVGHGQPGQRRIGPRPDGGHQVVATLSDAEQLIATVEELGGAAAALERGYQQREIAEAAYAHQRAVEEETTTIVGVNAYRAEEEVPGAVLEIDPDAEARQVERLREVRQRRNGSAVELSLDSLRQAAGEERNLMPPILDCVRAEATLAAANLIYLLLVAAGGVVLPTTSYGALAPVIAWLPSGALGDALRAALQDGSADLTSLAVLLGWTVIGTLLTARTFTWE